MPARRLEGDPVREGRAGRELFEQVALPHLGAVYQFALGLTGNHTSAEDLVQETFLNAYRSFDRFQIGTNCKAWLFRICKNSFIDGYREQKRRPRHQAVETAEPGAFDAPHDTQAFERLNIDQEDLFLDLFGDEVNRFLAELPAEFRQAMLLCDLEGLSYEEIADTLEIPIGTVRSRISRARSFLRERLEDYAKDLGYVRAATTGGSS